MHNNNNVDELIEQYLKGELSGNSLDEFNEMIAADDQFRKEVALQKAIIRNIKELGRKEWALKLQTMHNNVLFSDLPQVQEAPEEKKWVPVKSLHQKKYFLPAAAMVIFIIISTSVIVTINNRHDAQHMFLAYYQPYPNLEPGRRSLGPGNYSGKKEAFEAYDEGNYTECILLFNNILKNREDELVLFYLGNAYLSANKPAEAERIFTKYLNRYKVFAVDARWYLSLSYLQQEKRLEARKLLEDLAKEKNGYSKKAEEVLSKW